MGRCRDCSDWNSPNKCATVGRCDKLFMCVEVEDVCSPIYWTKMGFGCDLFREKPKGPFEVKLYGDHYILRHIETRYSFGDWNALIRAARVCDHLNELWAIAIGKRRE